MGYIKLVTFAGELGGWPEFFMEVPDEDYFLCGARLTYDECTYPCDNTRMTGFATYFCKIEKYVTSIDNNDYVKG